jgi:hypothetical protein
VTSVPGFEPGSFSHKARVSAPREPKSPSLSRKVSWTSFEAWLKNEHDRDYAIKLRNYAARYAYVLFEPGKAAISGGFSKTRAFRQNIEAHARKQPRPIKIHSCPNLATA